jgi:hypothetical protein
MGRAYAARNLSASNVFVEKGNHSHNIKSLPRSGQVSVALACTNGMPAR